MWKQNNKNVRVGGRYKLVWLADRTRNMYSKFHPFELSKMWRIVISDKSFNEKQPRYFNKM